MTRKRTNKKTKNKNALKKTNLKYGLILSAILIIAAGSIIALTSQDTEPSENQSSQPGKWLFAMDTANIQHMYSVTGIPTLVVIDPNGSVIYYSAGAHSKEQLIPYIESAEQGTAESLGESLDFTVTTFNNEEFTLSEHRGEVVLLDIMGVGCPPCETQMPELQKIKQEKGEDITILSVDVRYTGETEEDVRDTYGEYIKE